MNNENRGAYASFIISVLYGTGFSAISAIALVFISGGILISGKDPGRYAFIAALAVLAVSSFIGGYTGAKKGSSIGCGIVSGVIFAVLLFVFSLFISENEPVTVMNGTLNSLLTKTGVIILSALGALAASKTHSRKRSLKAAPRVPKIKKI